MKRLRRWLGIEHTGPIRVRARHWWEWRRANRVERYLNWIAQTPEFKAAQEEALFNAIMYGGFFYHPPGVYGRGIGELLEEKKN